MELMNTEAEKIIESLKLIEHPEGGYFREVYRSTDSIQLNFLPHVYKSGRNFSTSIYYMLVGEQISNFHKLLSDETWHFYKGSHVIIHMMHGAGNYERKILGNECRDDIFPQFTINAGTWFAAEIEDKNYYSLVGCAVAPGFNFEDFELGNRKKLCLAFPEHTDMICRFTKTE